MKKEEPKLKPCPFCGSKDVRLTGISNFTSHPKRLMVLCQVCGGGGVLAYRPYAIAAWNKRAKR